MDVRGGAGVWGNGVWSAPSGGLCPASARTIWTEGPGLRGSGHVEQGARRVGGGRVDVQRCRGVCGARRWQMDHKPPLSRRKPARAGEIRKRPHGARERVARVTLLSGRRSKQGGRSALVQCKCRRLLFGARPKLFFGLVITK